MLDPVRIRFRTDGFFAADDAAAQARGDKMQWYRTVEELENTPPAVPGDCWRSRWYRAAGEEGPVAGYAICCPKCLHVHAWNQAHGCTFNPRTYDYIDNDGVTHTSTVCGHSGQSSCWNWTGSPEEGTLSATPSLHCAEALGGCGWHGHLTNGVLKHC